MFSGKTTELFRRYKRHMIGGKSVLMVKYKGDDRYSSDKVMTHDMEGIEGLATDTLKNIDCIVKKYDVICIDEIQFYKDGDVYCDKWASQGKIIEACGLSGTFQRKPFPIVSNLIAQAETCVMLSAICRKTGNDASFTTILKKPNDGNIEIIGGSELYMAVDRPTYNNYMKFNT